MTLKQMTDIEMLVKAQKEELSLKSFIFRNHQYNKHIFFDTSSLLAVLYWYTFEYYLLQRQDPLPVLGT